MELATRPSNSQIEISINDLETPTEESRARHSLNKKVNVAAICTLCLGVTGGIVEFSCKSDSCMIAGAVLLGTATAGLIITGIAACFLRMSRLQT